MSDLERVLKLAGREAQTEAHSQETREMKAGVEEAVGDFADPILNLIDEVGSHQVVLDELIRYLDADTIEDFVADFRRHNDMDMKEATVTHHDKYKDYGMNDTWEDLNDLADWADTWASKNGVEYGEYDDYGIDDLEIDFEAAGVDTKAKAIKYMRIVQAGGSDFSSIDEADIDENAFNQAAAAAARAGESEFEFNGKKYKTKMDKETAHKLDDDVQFDEGKMSDQIIHDSETMSKEEFAKKYDKEMADEYYESVQESLEEAACGCCGNTPCDCGPDCDCRTDESAEEISEAPTMDTTQLIVMLKNAGLSEEAIEKKINEWANSAPDAAEQEQTSHGEPYENFAQSVNLSLKRYLDAENMKVNVSEHTVENMKALYESKKSNSK